MNNRLRKMIEPEGFFGPRSAIYSRIASVMEPAYGHIARQLALPESVKTVLDIGGGDGRLAVALARHYPHLSRIVTADLSTDMADRARKRAQDSGFGDRIASDVSDVHNLGYEDSYFDAIVSFGSMHHWRDPVAGLRELDRVLKPGGILAVMDGYDRPSFNTIRTTVSDFGGSIWTAIVYWVGSRQVLMYAEIAQIVERSGLGYISMLPLGPIVVVGGIKE